MTTINPASEAARESAREASGQFGAQEHSAPEESLVPPEESLDVVLENLSWVHARDSHNANVRFMASRVEAFVADAQAYVPTATGAAWSFEDTEWGTRLRFDHYYDAEGQAVESEDGSFPDIMDFEIDDKSTAVVCGFRVDEDNRITMEFSDVKLPDAERARAELRVSEKIEREKDSVALRGLIGSALDGGLDPEKLNTLSDRDVAELRRILAQAADTARMLLERKG